MKSYWSIALVFLSLIVITSISGCKTEVVGSGLEISPFDSGEIEATILSLRQYDYCSYREGIYSEECSVDTNPSDSATILVDSILEYNRNSRSQFLPLSQGMELEAQFVYSSRPAKVVHIPIVAVPAEPSESRVESESEGVLPKAQKPGDSSVPRENGLYIYTVWSGRFAEEYETILPGLSVGDKINVEISYSDFGISLHEYEIISENL